MSEENEQGDDSQKDASEIDEFQFYFSFTKPLVLELPSSEDRAIAAAWVQKLEAEPESEEEKQQRLNYLKLLLFVLQRGRLSGIFKKQPPSGSLQPFPQGFSILDMGNWMLNQDDGQTCGGGDARNLPYTVELSNDLREFVASQEIPNFGIQMYYAWSSDEPVHKWESFDEEKFPQYILDKIKQLKETKSDEKAFIVKNGCLSKKKGCDLTLSDKYSKKKVKSPQEIERSQGRSFHTYMGLVGRMGNFNDKCDDDPEKFQRQDPRKAKCQRRNVQKRCPGSGGEAEGMAPEEEFDNFVTGLGGLNTQGKSCPCPTPCHHQNRNDLQLKGGPQSFEDPQAACGNISSIRADVECLQYPVSVNNNMSPRRNMVEAPPCPDLDMPEMMPQQRSSPRSRSISPNRENLDCPPGEVERMSPPCPARSPACPPSQTRPPVCPPSQARSPTCPPDSARSPACPSSQARSPMRPPSQARTQFCPPGQARSPVCPPDPARSPACPPSQTRPPVCPPSQARSPTCPPDPARSPACPSSQARSPMRPPSQARTQFCPPEPSRTPECPPAQKSQKQDVCPPEEYRNGGGGGGGGAALNNTYNSAEGFASCDDSDIESPLAPRGGGMRSGVPEIIHCYDARNPDPSLAPKLEKQWTQTAREFNRDLDTDLKLLITRDQVAGNLRRAPCPSNVRRELFPPLAESTRIDYRSCQPTDRTSDRCPPSRQTASAPMEQNPCNYAAPEDIPPPRSPRGNQRAAYGQQQIQQNYVECEGEAPPPKSTPDPCAPKTDAYKKCPPSQMNSPKNAANYQCNPLNNDSGRLANMNNVLQGMKQRTETSKDVCGSAGVRRSPPAKAPCYPGNVQARPQISPTARPQQIAFDDGGMPGVCGGELNSSRNARPGQQMPYSPQSKATQPCGPVNQRGYASPPNTIQNNICTSQQQQQFPQRQQQMPPPADNPECYPAEEEAEPCPEEEDSDCILIESVDVGPSASKNMSRNMLPGVSSVMEGGGNSTQEDCEPQNEEEPPVKWASMGNWEAGPEMPSEFDILAQLMAGGPPPSFEMPEETFSDYQIPYSDLGAAPARSPGGMAQQSPRDCIPQQAPSMNASQRECTPQQAPRMNASPRNGIPQQAPGMNASQRDCTRQQASRMNASPRDCIPQQAPSMNASQRECTPQQAPRMNASPRDCIPQQAPGMNASQRECTPQQAPRMNASPRDCIPQQAPGMNASQRDCTRQQASRMNASPRDGIPQQAPSMNASQRECTPQQAPRMNASPRDGIPQQDPQMTAYDCSVTQVEGSGVISGTRFSNGGNQGYAGWVSPKIANLEEVNAFRQGLLECRTPAAPSPRPQAAPCPRPQASPCPRPQAAPCPRPQASPCPRPQAAPCPRPQAAPCPPAQGSARLPNYPANCMPPQAMESEQQFQEEFCEPQMGQGPINGMDQYQDQNYMNLPLEEPADCYDEYEEVNPQLWVSMPIRQSGGGNKCPQQDQGQRNCPPNGRSSRSPTPRDPYCGQNYE